MLHHIRVVVATLSMILITFLFLDISGLAVWYLQWVAAIQFLPALMALNMCVVASLVVFTFLFGRLYCSVVCPLGILQDLFAFVGKRHRRNRYSYSPAKRWLRWGSLALFVVSLLFGFGFVVSLLAPYSSYGRIATNLWQPLYLWGNNLLALIAEHYDSYAFYSVEVWVRSGVSLAVAVVSLATVGVLSYRHGRTYCNTVCPVGTILSFVARVSLFAPVIDKRRCVKCRLCERNCKSSCIDIKGGMKIDGSRCVDCFECTRVCPKGAVSFRLREWGSGEPTPQTVDKQKRTFLTMAGLALASTVTAQKDKLVDGGLTVLDPKASPHRDTPLVPPGSQSLANLRRHCTACQLCIAKCPNHVLKPSTSLAHFMQPEMDFAKGYCRPNCTTCSHVCPTAAIRPVDQEEKTTIQIGHAVWNKELCIVETDDVNCGNCARHCPAGAIAMITVRDNDKLRRFPAVDTEMCIGCGSCENVCPVRPLSAISVEGHEVHRKI